MALNGKRVFPVPQELLPGLLAQSLHFLAGPILQYMCYQTLSVTPSAFQVPYPPFPLGSNTRMGGEGAGKGGNLLRRSVSVLP